MNEALTLLQSLIQEVMQAQDEFTDNELEQIQHTFSEAARIIQEQQGEEPEIEPGIGAIPELNEAPYPSSNINAFKYEPETNKLFVKFMGKDVADAGPIYSYEGVPKYIFDIFARGAIGPKTSGSNRWHTWKEGITPSHGAAMAALIKAGGFPYQRIS